MLWSLVLVNAKVDGVAGLKAGESTYLIRCDLLEGSHNGWGYKGRDESMHPYYYSCPLEYLEIAPDVSPGWRKRVREHHQANCQA